MASVTVCKCDIPGCDATAQVPEMPKGHVRCPEEWCEIRAFPPESASMLSAHVCPKCWAEKLLPLLGPGMARDRKRLEFLSQLARTKGVEPTWLLSQSDIKELKAGRPIEVEDEDD